MNILTEDFYSQINIKYKISIYDVLPEWVSYTCFVYFETFWNIFNIWLFGALTYYSKSKFPNYALQFVSIEN